MKIDKSSVSTHTDTGSQAELSSAGLHGGVARIKKLLSVTLFEGASAVAITHQDETYFLRITKQNKLILTK